MIITLAMILTKHLELYALHITIVIGTLYVFVNVIYFDFEDRKPIKILVLIND